MKQVLLRYLDAFKALGIIFLLLPLILFLKGHGERRRKGGLDPHHAARRKAESHGQ